MLLFLILPVIFSSIVAVNFFYHLANGRFLTRRVLMRVVEIWTVFIAPLYFLSVADLSQQNDCCTDSALFAPGHRTGIYVLIFLSVAAYFYSSFRKRLATPVLELLINALLLQGLVLNTLLVIHIDKQELGTLMWLFGIVPIIMLFLVIMKKNQQLLERVVQQGMDRPKNNLAAASLKLLQAKVWVRLPALAILLLPLLLLLTLTLFLFGQQPDTLIRAFTDTYKHGFSQLDYMCDNVECGGHFLCSVAAKGHKRIVRPKRLGERHGHRVLCNRQLLVANAFEELLQDHWPFLHKHIRKQYNHVGNIVHRYYAVFNNKFMADLVYVAMKPLEWLFLLTLYTFDARPEDRIERQYISGVDIEALQNCGRRTTAVAVAQLLYKKVMTGFY